MKIEAWYSENFESDLSGRYITLNHINPLLKKYKNNFEISILGTSELGKNISLIKIGSGKKRILAWSQMHGNESTTTKSIFDFLKFISQKEVLQDEISNFLKNNTLFLVPMLNPDGAASYTRNNGNLVDLNRDAQDLSQKESKLLMNLFNSIQPDLCLNLHGQRTIFGLNTGNPATVSFLSPASNKEREVTPSRKIAMSLIVIMNADLQKYIPNQIGRYDDSFNSNCFGDYFQMKEVPVILFEAGHFKEDYQREKTRKYIFYSLLSVLGIGNSVKDQGNYKDYFSIPENQKNYKDIIIRNVRIKSCNGIVSIAIQFSEKLIEGKIKLIPLIDEVGDLDHYFAHKEIVGKGNVVLVNSQEEVEIGTIVSEIVNKNDNSLVYFNENNFLF
ncbi:MAG: peptidase M14 [Flavobacterium sp.]|nr:MAG: peptidase M14 [Flavobacterium sp.]